MEGAAQTGKSQITLYFEGGRSQDDFLQVIDKVAKFVAAAGQLAPLLGFSTAGQAMSKFSYVRRVVWTCFALRDVPLLVNGKLTKEDEPALNSILILKTSFSALFSLNSAFKLIDHFKPSPQLAALANQMGKASPYFVTGMTSIATASSIQRGVRGKWDEDKAGETLSLIGSSSDLFASGVPLFLRTFGIAAPANFVIATASATMLAATMQLTTVARRHTSAAA